MTTEQNLRNIFAKVSSLSLKANSELSLAWRHICLHGFCDDCDQPILNICNDNTIIMVWDGMELSEDEIISLMNENGYIEPLDFKP